MARQRATSSIVAARAMMGLPIKRRIVALIATLTDGEDVPAERQHDCGPQNNVRLFDHKTWKPLHARCPATTAAPARLGPKGLARRLLALNSGALPRLSDRLLGSARPPCILWPLRRTVHRARTIALRKKSIFNFGVDAMEPLLGPGRSLLISGDLRFQLRNPIFSRAQLIRELLRQTKRVGCFRRRRRPLFVLIAVLCGLRCRVGQRRPSRFFNPAQTGSYPTRSYRDHASLCPPQTSTNISLVESDRGTRGLFRPVADEQYLPNGAVYPARHG